LFLGPLYSFAEKYSNNTGLAVVQPLFSQMVAELLWIRDHSWLQTWVTWNRNLICIANWNADVHSIGRGIQEACYTLEHLADASKRFYCTLVPSSCTNSLFRTADYVFSLYYHRLGTQSLDNCYFNGSASYVVPTVYRSLDKDCVITTDAETTALSAESFQIIRAKNDANENVIFARRVITGLIKANVSHPEKLESFGEYAPTTWLSFLSQLRTSLWVCGGETGRICRTGSLDMDTNPWLIWMIWPVTILLLTFVLTSCISYCYIILTPDSSKQWFEKQQMGRLGKVVSDDTTESTDDST